MYKKTSLGFTLTGYGPECRSCIYKLLVVEGSCFWAVDKRYETPLDYLRLGKTSTQGLS